MFIESLCVLSCLLPSILTTKPLNANHCIYLCVCVYGAKLNVKRLHTFDRLTQWTILYHIPFIKYRLVFHIQSLISLCLLYTRKQRSTPKKCNVFNRIHIVFVIDSAVVWWFGKRIGRLWLCIHAVLSLCHLLLFRSSHHLLLIDKMKWIRFNSIQNWLLSRAIQFCSCVFFFFQLA